MVPVRLGLKFENMDMDAHFAYTYDAINSKDYQDILIKRGLNTGPAEDI